MSRFLPFSFVWAPRSGWGGAHPNPFPFLESVVGGGGFFLLQGKGVLKEGPEEKMNFCRCAAAGAQSRKSRDKGESKNC